MAWSHFSNYGPDAENSDDLFVRQVNADGTPNGSPVSLELSLFRNNLADPTVATTDDRALVAWTDGGDIMGWVLEIVDEVICGDVNRDGSTSATDALMTLSAAVGSRYCSKLLCDADGDGTIDTTDGLRILRSAVGLDAAPTCT